MAASEDARDLQWRVYDLAGKGKSVELGAMLEEHPEVDVDEYKSDGGERALAHACRKRRTECARLLITHGADVNAQDNYGYSALHRSGIWGHLSCAKLLVQNGADVNIQDSDNMTALIVSISDGHLSVAQYLLEHKADIHYRIGGEGGEEDWGNWDALLSAMSTELGRGDLLPGDVFAVLCCNTDAKNVCLDFGTNVTAIIRDTHIETYSHVQAFIDEYHRILNLVLSEHVPVDPRFGLGQMGIYQEPLERTLEYLGLSMSKNQVVNTSIDGEAGGVRRALIPGHLLNASHWFDKYTNR
jgi:hypothetical protein